ncbi:MAG: SDR family oxidoreductase [Clostridiales bacterium]|nr:SDR family oxidoreductase [Clostridiales bacterium]
MIHENLKGRVAVVTGGGGVLCAGFSKALAKQGVKVAVLDLNEQAAATVADEINAEGGTAIAVGCNVLEKESMENARKIVNEKLGTCDILLNGAGGNNPKGTTSKETLEKADLINKDESIKTFFDLDASGISFVFNLNFLGTLIPTQVFAADMAQKENSCIVMITSMNAYRPLTKIPAYSAAKAAVKNFTEFMAVHFADVGIRVNAIAPGFFSTNQNKTLLWNDDGTPTERTKKILAATPMKRFGEAEELTGALLFLCDENYSGFITGTSICVDGGFSAYSGV